MPLGRTATQAGMTIIFIVTPIRFNAFC